MNANEIPQADYAILGGAVTRQIRFPEAVGDPEIEVLATGLRYETPLGETIPLKLLRFWQGGQERRCLYARYLGVRSDAERMRETERVFWVFRAAGVQRIISEDNMGSLNLLLEPGDIVACNDFIDLRKEASYLFMPGQLVRMREPYCPELRSMLVAAAEAGGFRRVFRRGVYAVSNGTRFESPAEVAMYRQLGGDIVGYSLVPSIYLARAIGACFSGIYLVANYGEGLIGEWDHDEVWRTTDAVTIDLARVMLQVLKRAPLARGCKCREYLSPRPPETVNYPDK